MQRGLNFRICENIFVYIRKNISAYTKFYFPIYRNFPPHIRLSPAVQKEGIFLRGNGLAFELHTELFPAGEDLLLLLLELAVLLKKLGVRGMGGIGELLL